MRFYLLLWEYALIFTISRLCIFIYYRIRRQPSVHLEGKSEYLNKVYWLWTVLLTAVTCYCRRFLNTASLPQLSMKMPVSCWLLTVPISLALHSKMLFWNILWCLSVVETLARKSLLFYGGCYSTLCKFYYFLSLANGLLCGLELVL